ncbi:hypothetical protein FB451DRAFT_1498139 [Mycena latifolia]|nr:hypothetical protein FB451DRAFT_1498139 [Mycena latifolia]
MSGRGTRGTDLDHAPTRIVRREPRRRYRRGPVLAIVAASSESGTRSSPARKGWKLHPLAVRADESLILSPAPVPRRSVVGPSAAAPNSAAYTNTGPPRCVDDAPRPLCVASVSGARSSAQRAQRLGVAVVPVPGVSSQRLASGSGVSATHLCSLASARLRDTNTRLVYAYFPVRPDSIGNRYLSSVPVANNVSALPLTASTLQ